MQTYLLKLVTLIAEDVLENEITQALLSLGAQGYTTIKAHGKGTHGMRSSEWEGENVRIETIVSEEIAKNILKHISENYFKRRAVVAYLSNVEVLREEKYV